jgi:hypothetical protein
MHWVGNPWALQAEAGRGLEVSQDLNNHPIRNLGENLSNQERKGIFVQSVAQVPFREPRKRKVDKWGRKQEKKTQREELTPEKRGIQGN